MLSSLTSFKLFSQHMELPWWSYIYQLLKLTLWSVQKIYYPKYKLVVLTCVFRSFFRWDTSFMGYRILEKTSLLSRKIEDLSIFHLALRRHKKHKQQEGTLDLPSSKCQQYLKVKWSSYFYLVFVLILTILLWEETHYRNRLWASF